MSNLDPSGALLSFIHKNAAMGVGAIPQAMSLPQSRAMVPALDRQLREYRAIAAQSQAYARAHGRRELRGQPWPCPLPCCGPSPCWTRPHPDWRSG